MRRVVTVSIVASVALFSLWLGTAMAQVVNGGFETGDLTGWTASEGTGEVEVVMNGAGQNAVEGQFFALLATASLMAPPGPPVTVSQTFNSFAGDVIEGQAFFESSDCEGSINDFGIVRILRGATEVAVVFEANACDGSEPWTPWSYTVTQDGSYTVEASVQNTGDDAVSSFLGLDAVTGGSEGAGLIITKSCPDGGGDGDADFQVVVTQLVDTLAADSLDCGEIMVVSGASGTVTVTEYITGPDANNFLTAIVCSNDDGQTTTPGTQADVELEGATECAVVNFFSPPAPPTTGTGGTTPPGGGTVVVPIDITNTNNNDGTVTTTNINGGTVVNDNTNSGGQVLDNHNVEENDNINDNTQRQTVTRHQTNDSSQD